MCLEYISHLILYYKYTINPGSCYCVNTSTVVEEKSRTEKHKLWFEAMSGKSKKNEKSLHVALLLKNPQSRVGV